VGRAVAQQVSFGVWKKGGSGAVLLRKPNLMWRAVGGVKFIFCEICAKLGDDWKRGDSQGTAMLIP
jgi:hypothetical protein